MEISSFASRLPEHERCSGKKIALNVLDAARLQRPLSNDVREFFFFFFSVAKLFIIEHCVVGCGPGVFIVSSSTANVLYRVFILPYIHYECFSRAHLKTFAIRASVRVVHFNRSIKMRFTGGKDSPHVVSPSVGRGVIPVLYVRPPNVFFVKTCRNNESSHGRSYAFWLKCF